MKKILSTLLLFCMAMTLHAQDNDTETPNMLRYYLHDGTIYDVPMYRLDRLQRVGTIGWNNIFNDGEPNVSILFSQLDSVVFVYDPSAVKPFDNNINKNTDRRATGMEFPHLMGDAMNIISQPSTQQLGITYSLEWDCTKRAQRWTCYQMHNGLPNNNVGRNDSWSVDPNIPSQYQTDNSDYKNSGFSRGHMCPSSDRQTTVEQNRQTFYYSNMHPQYQNHNGVLWAKMEQQITNTWDKSSFRDTLYVVKAGTIRDDQIMQYTASGIPVPQYFYMAVLCLKNNQYKALAFWTKHENKSIKNANLADYAISIDELEERTGIDFFCNLPDDIEEQVESNLDVSKWGL